MSLANQDIPMARTYAGVTPFVVSDIVRVVVLVSFPAITMYLVDWVYGVNSGVTGRWVLVALGAGIIALMGARVIRGLRGAQTG